MGDQMVRRLKISGLKKGEEIVSMKVIRETTENFLLEVKIDLKDGSDEILLEITKDIFEQLKNWVI